MLCLGNFHIWFRKEKAREISSRAAFLTKISELVFDDFGLGPLSIINDL